MCALLVRPEPLLPLAHCAGEAQLRALGRQVLVHDQRFERQAANLKRIAGAMRSLLREAGSDPPPPLPLGAPPQLALPPVPQLPGRRAPGCGLPLPGGKAGRARSASFPSLGDKGACQLPSVGGPAALPRPTADAGRSATASGGCRAAAGAACEDLEPHRRQRRAQTGSPTAGRAERPGGTRRRRPQLRSYAVPDSPLWAERRARKAREALDAAQLSAEASCEAGAEEALALAAEVP
mmetsp:Transcript_26367/g.83503  ORF Transcript_26367/g.83503 Transcript_26367/m.83503 type:complete len:237 (-) Transcript_26367:141-851(-)